MISLSCILEWTLWRENIFSVMFPTQSGEGDWINNRKIIFAHKKMCLEPSVVLCPLRKQERGFLPLLLPITALLFQLWLQMSPQHRIKGDCATKPALGALYWGPPYNWTMTLLSWLLSIFIPFQMHLSLSWVSDGCSFALSEPGELSLLISPVLETGKSSSTWASRDEQSRDLHLQLCSIPSQGSQRKHKNY